MKKEVGQKFAKKPSFRRVIAYFIVFAVFGCFFLWQGFLGRNQLKSEAERLKNIKIVEIVQNEGIDLLKKEMLELKDDNDYRDSVNKLFNSQKRTVKKLIASMMKEDKPVNEVLKSVSEHYVSKFETNDEGVKQLVEQKITSFVGDIEESISKKLMELDKEYNLETAKRNLSANTKNFARMFYYRGLLGAGAAMLAFLLWLSIKFFTSSEEKRVELNAKLEPVDYLAPFFIGVILFTVYPVIRVIVMSFQERYKQDGSFLAWGFGNYSYVLKGIEGTSNYFMQGMRNTFLYVLYTVPLSTLIAIVIAYLLNQKLKFSALFQTAYFLPMVTSITAVGLVWRWIFNTDFGILNAIIANFGFSKIDWIMNPRYSMAVMVIFGIWNSMPFTIILLLSGLQNIDESYYTVARVDGARGFRIFRRITVPLLAPTIGLVLTINSISAFKIFTSAQVLFNGTPGPARNMYTVVYYIFEMMRESLELGRAAAASIILFLCIFVFTMLQRFIQRKWSY